MNRKELNFIKHEIRCREFYIEENRKIIFEMPALEVVYRPIIDMHLEEIATLQSIYRIVKEALKNGKTN